MIKPALVHIVRNQSYPILSLARDNGGTQALNPLRVTQVVFRILRWDHSNNISPFAQPTSCYPTVLLCQTPTIYFCRLLHVAICIRLYNGLKVRTNFRTKYWYYIVNLRKILKSFDALFFWQFLNDLFILPWDVETPFAGTAISSCCIFLAAYGTKYIIRYM